MASLTKKPNSQYLFACFRGLDGRQHRRSTGVTNERKAREIARTYEQIAQRKLKPAKFRETMVELYREIYGEAVPTGTVRQFATNWLNTKKAETVSRSWDSYQKSINKFLAFLGHDAELDVSLLPWHFFTAIAALEYLVARVVPTRLQVIAGAIESRAAFELMVEFGDTTKRDSKIAELRRGESKNWNRVIRNLELVGLPLRPQRY
jgi:hypothetical protein